MWKNQQVSWKTKLLETVVQYSLLILVLFVFFLLISFFNVLAPPFSSHIDTSGYTSLTILFETVPQVDVQSWCVKNQVLVQESGSSSLIYQRCQGYLSSLSRRTGVSIAIAIGIILIRFILKQLALFIMKYRSFKTTT